MKTYKPGERVKSKMNGAFTHDEVFTRKRRLFKIAKIKEALIQVKVSVYSKGGIYLIKYSSKNGPRRLLLNMASGGMDTSLRRHGISDLERRFKTVEERVIVFICSAVSVIFS